MAIDLPVDVVDSTVLPINDVVVMHKMLLTRTRIVVRGDTYVSAVSSSAANLRAILAHIRRTDRAQAIVDLAKTRTMLLPTDTVVKETRADDFKFNI